MADSTRCSSCGLALDGSRPGDLCPACLLKLGLAASGPATDAEAPEGATVLGPATSARTGSAASEAATAFGAATPGASHDGATPRGWSTSPASSPPSHSTADTPRTIGPYRLVRTLGEGGMGIVYLAEQDEPIRRTVALKLIKLGMDTHEVVARFEAERQALALMDHSNIASVLDAGATLDGRPYFVMEYAPGVPLTDYCDAKRLSTRERLQIFIEVCAAVQHAHQKGIIHRDLKPSNVLVIEEDGRPIPKVIDFGIAKATDQRLTERTMFTQHGLLVGTPEYMSPEQAELGAVDLDTRTDIYSLGVMLYELLVGSLPFSPTRLREAGYTGLIRIIREEEPDRPSTRLTTAGGAATRHGDAARRDGDTTGPTGTSGATSAIEVAARRRTKVLTLAQELRGDLDWITLKALEKDRARRYASVSEFAADITRYLADEPVSARPPSLSYRVQKFVRRNRLAVTAASIVALAVIGGLIISSVLYVRAERARADAERQRTIAEDARRDASARAVSEAQARKAADASAYAERVARTDAETQKSRAEQALSDAEHNLYFNNIALADREWTNNDIAHVDQLLAEAPVRLRAWEWHHLSRLNHMERAAVRVPGSGIVALQIDPKAEAFLAATGDLRVVTYSTKTWLVRRTVTLAGPPPTAVTDAVFSPDGRSFAAKIMTLVPRVGTAMKVWNTVTGAVRWSADDEALGTTRHLAFDPSGAYVLAVVEPTPGAPLARPGSPQREVPTVTNLGAWTVKAWDVDTGRSRPPLASSRAPVTVFALNRTGSRIVVSSVLSTRVVDVFSGLVLTEFQRSPTPEFVVFSPDGRSVVDVLESGALRMWNVADGKNVWYAPGPARNTVATAARTSVAFTPDGLRVIATAPDRSLRVLDARTGVEMSRQTGHTGDLTALVMLADGSAVLSGGTEGFARLWQIPVAKPDVPSRRTEFADSVTVSIDTAHNLVVASTRALAMKAWTLDTLRLMSSIPERNAGGIFSSPAAQAERSGPVVLSGLRAMLPGRRIGAMPDGTDFGGYEYTVIDVRTGAVVTRLPDPGLAGRAPDTLRDPGGTLTPRMSAVNAARLDPTGRRAIVAAIDVDTTEDGTLRADASLAGSHLDFWTIGSTPSVRRVRLQDMFAASLVFSPSGDRVVVVAADMRSTTGKARATVQIRDSSTGTLLCSFESREMGKTPPVFDSAGERMATVSTTNGVTVRNARTGAPIVTLPEQTQGIAAVAFSPNGSRLGQIASDGMVKLFDSQTGKLLITLQESDGPFSKREVVIDGRPMQPGPPALMFSPDGQRVVATTMTSDPIGLRIRVRTWDGSPRDARR